MKYYCFFAALGCVTSVGLSQQPHAGLHLDVHVTESRHGLVCDPLAGKCITTQLLVATVGSRIVELRLYESRVQPLLALGTYPGELVIEKTAPSYRKDESYMLTYPDGKTEKYEVVGIRQE